MEKVRLGLVGCGGFMRHRLHQMLAVPEVEIVGMADLDPSQIAETKAKHPALAQVAEYAGIDALLEAGTCDAVMLVTPHKGHRYEVVSSFAAGLHVLVEKPLACSVEDARACLEARDRSGRVGAVSYQRHGFPELQWLRGVLQGGPYGPLLMANSVLAQDWKNFTEGTWRQDPDISQGGMLNDSGSHIFDLLLWTTGLRPSAVSCISDNRGTRVDIDTVTSIRFSGGAMASVCVMGHACAWHERHVFVLEGAMVSWTDGVVELKTRKGDDQVPHEWPSPVTPDQNFVDVVLGRGDVLAPFECGMDVVRLTRACYESAERGGTVVMLA
jgi:predicted dehydrogenase